MQGTKWNVLSSDGYDWRWSLSYIDILARRVTDLTDSQRAKHDNGRIRQCLETQISFLIHAISFKSSTQHSWCGIESLTWLKVGGKIVMAMMLRMMAMILRMMVMIRG